MRHPKLVQALSANHKHLAAIIVERVEGDTPIPVGSVPLTDAEGVPVEHGSHPALDAGEICDAAQNLAREHVRTAGAGWYEATLIFAKPPRGSEKKPETVRWHQGASETDEKEEASLQTMIRRYSLAAWKDHHGAHLETFKLTAKSYEQTFQIVERMATTVVNALVAVNEMMQRAAERESRASNTSLELEMMKQQQETERMRTNVAIAALRQFAPGAAKQLEGDPAKDTDKPSVTFADAPVVDIEAKGRGMNEHKPSRLVEVANRFARSISAEQLERVEAKHPTVVPHLRALRYVTTDEEVRDTFKRASDAIAGDFASLLAFVEGEQVMMASELADLVAG